MTASRVPQFTSLPDGWQALPLRRLVRFVSGADVRDCQVEEGGYPVFGSGGEFARASRFMHEGPSVLFGRKGTIDRPLYVEGRFWATDTAYYTVPSERVHPRFLYYAALTIPFRLYMTNTALPSMSQRDLMGHVIPVPPLVTQAEIVAFLDRETAQIDALIAKQERLVELVQERRVAVVEEAVAAADGLGEARPLGSVLERVDVRLPGADLPLMSVSQTLGVVRRSSLTDAPPRAASLDLYKVCRAGQLVFNKMKVRAGAIGIAPEDGLVTYHYEVMKVRSDAVPEYLVYLMKSKAFTAELVRRERGLSAGDESSRVRTTEVPFSALKSIPIRLPAVTRQREIIERLSDVLAAADQLVEKTREHIALAKERRAALITAAVTGQIDVGGRGG